MAVRAAANWVGATVAIYRAVLVAVMITIAGLIAVSVIARYVFGSPILYSYELASLLFVWLVFLSLPGGGAAGVHLAADILTPYLPDRTLVALRVVSHALAVAVLAYIGWYAWILAGRTRVMMPTLGLSLAWMYAAVPIGTLLYIGWIIGDTLTLLGVLPDPHARKIDA